jgi:hypothetical protein
VNIGTIVEIQVQRSSLKVPGPVGRYYDPSPIEQVTSLELTPGGVLGRGSDGTSILDVHHRDHPMSKNRDLNGISIGFVSHYELMRRRAGEHLSNGLAGENLLVQTDNTYIAADLPEELVVETQSGQVVRLIEVQVAEPCVEFTKFTLQYSPDTRPDHRVSEMLDFLRRGMRGYYATYQGQPTLIHLGDQLRVYHG